MVPVDAAFLLGLLVAAPAAALLVLTSALFRSVARNRGLIPAGAVSWVEKRRAVLPAAGVLAVYVLVVSFGAFVEARWVQLTRTEIPVDRAVLGRDRLRLVHLSDLHLVDFGGRERRVVDLVREAKPHLILLTGDYMNVREAMDDLDRLLRLLAAEAPLGVYGIGGNMDTKFITRTIFERAGVRFLEDDTHLVPGPEGGRGLRLVGHSIRPSVPLRELLQGLKDDAFTVYLHHSPDAVDELRDRDADQRVDLFLTGHTHGGQVCLPLWGAVVTLSKYHKKYERGLYDARGVPMYVNRGVGTTGLPVRFLARPEVAVIDLVVRP